jgi:catechol 2,3-dioxygenase-like lactoylglutathione lyase family enzyme
MSWIRLRQVALVAKDLDAVVAQLGDVLGIAIAHHDPAVGAFGLRNAVLPVGTQFVEVVSPITDGTAAGRQLDRLGGDGGYMVICHTDDHPAVRSRVDDLGVRVALEADEHGYKILQLHPADTGGSFLEIDFQPGGDDPTGPWMPAGPRWQDAVRTSIVDGIAGVELRVADPEAVRDRWSAVLGLPAEGDHIELDNATVLFREGTGGLVAVDVRGRGQGTHRIGGVDFRFVG